MNKFLKFSLIFLISYTFFLLVLPQHKELPENKIIINGNKEFSIGDMVSFDVLNNTKKDVIFNNSCPNSTLKVDFFDSGEKKEISKNIETKDCKSFSLKSGEKKVFDFGNENIELFNKIGDYKVIFETSDGKIYEQNFKITPQGFFSKIWNSVFYKPLYNFLIWLIKVGPAHSLVFAIIILTIFIKVALLFPNHKALKNQKQLQKIQPKLDEIKKKFAGDQAKIAQETMKIWKSNGVNPMGSCLPVLIQFPFLIALFYIIKNGLSVNHSDLLYPFLSNFDYTTINTDFFGLFNLADTKVVVLALIVGATQYWQMELTFKNKTEPTGSDFMAMQMQMMSKMMKYVMPIMISVFTFIMPAGLGIYWFISTLFAALQQLYVNHSSDNNGNNNSNNGKKSGKKIKNKDISDAVIVERKSGKKSGNDLGKKDGITVIEA